MGQDKRLRMDDVGPRLARIVKDLRTLQDQLHSEQLGTIIEELATVATMVLSWRALVEMNGVKLPDEDKDTS